MAVNLDRIQAPLLSTPTLSDGGSLAADTTYYYCVVCTGGQDSLSSYLHHFESPRSNIVSVTTTATQKTVNLSWTAPTITQSGVLNTAGYQHDNYAVLRSTSLADLQGKENVPILITSGSTVITTLTNSYVDDNSKTASGAKSYFWYRPHGCPKFHITGFTEAVPCTMKDIYAADIAGTLELMPSLPASGSPHRLYTPVNPSDSRQLKLDIIVTDYSTEGTVVLTGKDAGGDAKGETINITENGTYTTVLTYASIDEEGIVCTGDYNLQIVQRRWGFIEKHRVQFGTNISSYVGSNNWTLHCGFYNEGHFLTKRENIFIVGGFNPTMAGLPNCSFVAGEVTSTGAGKNGSQINFFNRVWFQQMNGPLAGYMKLYASKINYVYDYMYKGPSGSSTWLGAYDWRLSVGSNFYAIDSVFDILCGDNGFLLNSSPNMARSMFGGSVQPRGTGGIFDFKGMNMIDGRIAHQVDKNSTTKNLNIYSNIQDIHWWTSNADNPTYINCTFHRTADAELYNEPYYFVNSPYFASGVIRTGTFKSTLNIKVINIDGSAIENARVVVTRSDGIQEGDELTSASGSIDEIKTTYSIHTLTGGISGADTGFATGNRGGLTPVTPKITATNYIHTLAISKTGYQTYTCQLDMSKKKDLVIKLEKAVPIYNIIGDDVKLVSNASPSNPQNKILLDVID